MLKGIQAVRGMNDILPAETPYWQQVEDAVREVVQAYGYEELRLPLLEKTDLFKRTIGEVTDIVEKEMYTFDDRNGDSLTLRPEGTAGCVRAGIEHGLLYNQVQRFWYGGPMFRHERPQQGRYRQFHQIGVEAFGMAGPGIDIEHLLMTARIWRRLGLDGLSLQINSLGSTTARRAYRERLVGYLRGRSDELDDDSRRRLETNPLRILDSKNPAMRALIDGAPLFSAYLEEQSLNDFAAIKSALTDAGVAYSENPRLVRGLDYYNETVYEWVTDQLGAQGTVCAGGRYDGLVEQLGGKPTPGAGFALGLDRIVTLLQQAGDSILQRGPRAYLALVGQQAEQYSLLFAERLRNRLPGLRLTVNCGGGSIKSQMKRADKSGADIALVLGDEEMQNKQIGVKFLRLDRQQERVDQDEIDRYLKQELTF
ncbi:MAG: histidyl-tRNA synthetase [Gammaproteobacteria bacterium]|nr:MAG: histidyl-tRNA synthetase [Gammaproteobacteria bacterium]TND00887.1 MAG: histidyl-tRNA synthetase [Gammaproteobacteria bacterium]